MYFIHINASEQIKTIYFVLALNTDYFLLVFFDFIEFLDRRDKTFFTQLIGITVFLFTFTNLFDSTFAFHTSYD